MTYLEDITNILLIFIHYFGLKYMCVLSLSVIECKSIVMKYNYVMHLKHGLILMLKALFTSQQTSVVLSK